MLKEHKGGFILSYNDCPTIREYYKEYKQYFPKWQYTMGQGEKRNKRLKEKYKISQNEWRDLTQQVWFIYPKDIKRGKGHPAPFPEKLVARLIKMFSFGSCKECNYEGDIVLDPFAGIGTTLKVAKQMKDI